MTTLSPPLSLPEVTDDVNLTDEQKRRLLSAVYGSGKVDYNYRYTHAGGEPRDLAFVHFCSQAKDIPGGESHIAGVDGRVFESTAFVYFEDQSGAIHGWNDCAEAVSVTWHHGVLLEGSDGGLWLCAVTEPGKGMITGEEPLIRVSSETCPEVLHNHGRLQDNLPSEGEFYCSKEDEPVITSIPWWTSSRPGEVWHDGEAQKEFQNVVDRIQERISEMTAETEFQP